MNLDDAGISIDQLGFGPLAVENVTLRRDGDLWRGGGDLRLLGVGFDGYALDAKDDPDASPTPTGFGIGTDGSFRYAGRS